MNKIPKLFHWHTSSSPPSLSAKDLHLWKIPSGPDGGQVGTQWPLLSASERERADRLRLPRHRGRYIRAHADLRRILGLYLKIDPIQIDFEHGIAGKPMLLGAQSAVEFNLTTSGDLALVAVSLGYPVGVDCEQIREQRDVAAISRRMFDPEEAERIAAAPVAEQPARFFRSWTALEAGVKADGRGLARRKEEPGIGRLQIAHCVPETGFLAAVARESLPPVADWVTLQLDAD
ncbi:MAG: 4'-phosphopantetheinyl transferase superfamily protein [Pseudomonadota bacterium]|nr:4'-phosphopantetheinyl transferase superfamily protein [Pseudomonadota bacterium]